MDIAVGVFNDTAGTFVSNLNTANFKVRIGNTDAHVEAAAPSTDPGRVLILIDNSASMAKPRGSENRNVWVHVTGVARQFIAAAPPGTQIAVAALDGSNSPVHFTRDKQVAISALEAVPAGPSTLAGSPLLDSMVAAIRSLGTVSHTDLLLVFSDGEDNRSESMSGDVAGVINRAGMRWAAVWLRPRHPRAQDVLPNVASSTRGALFRVDTPKLVTLKLSELNNEAAALSRDLIAFAFLRYRLSIEVPASKKPQKVAVKALDDNGRQLTNKLFHLGHVPPCRPH